MSWTKEITEDRGKRVDVAHQTRRGYKTISKEFGQIHSQTDRVQMEEIHATVTFPKSGRPTKITLKQNV